MSKAGKMWGGRFSGSLHPEFEAFQKSLPVDHVLAFADLEVNHAWAGALGEAGVIGKGDVKKIRAAIEKVAAEWERDGIPADDPAEDVHSLVEKTLAKHVGDLAKRIHTGRSRNDQVATDLRIFLRNRSLGLVLAVQELIEALVRMAERHADLPLPGFTHMQRAQPVTVGHHALAYVEMLWRDRGRITDAWHRMNQCPLGSGALAGTALPIDRDKLAQELNFDGGPTRNSLDATADRDAATELAFACAMTMVHLSRLCEDAIFYASYECRYLTFTDAVSTGSSLMPQKRNPDAMELVRGHAGKVCGMLQSLLILQKGLPLAYNRDLQEDKESVIGAVSATQQCLRIATIAVESMRWDETRCRAAAETGYLNATDLADLLVAAGVSFRDAHEIVGKAVNRAVELGVELQDLPEADRKKLLPALKGDLREQLSAEAVLARRGAIGGTAPKRVREQVEAWNEIITSWHEED